MGTRTTRYYNSGSNLGFLPILFFIFAFCLAGKGVYAFGAGNIPSYAFLEGKAFRHGDIEDILESLAKTGAGFSLGKLVGKHKFGGLDIKRVYFGNWLRDYSQAVDIAGLKKLPLQTIINLCMVLGFLAHGYATNEFEVTPERLSCYLPTEHIDNPKGYGEGEDARKYHPGLRGPVDPRELEVDPRTGMKNYIANEQGGWDTSKALVRRTLQKCIELGRKHKQTDDKRDLYECYRLLGTALHTLEDFTAHSNFCEIALVSMGYSHVFQHVGDNVRIQAPNGKWVAPIVTGTFGGNDFIHSLLGEAGDHLSQASVTELNHKMDESKTKSRSGGSSEPTSVLMDLFAMLPGESGQDMKRELDDVARLRTNGSGMPPPGKKPEEMSPQELHAVLWKVLSFRDSVAKKITHIIEGIPGLGSLLEKIGDGISVFVFSTLEPYIKPLIQTATTGLSAASGEVIDSHDQYEVFNLPNASDPTHSFLSKDHFNLILNEPAGRIAQIIVKHTVQQVTRAWGDTSVDVHHLTEDVLQCLFHPDFSNNSPIQREMLGFMQSWVQSLGHNQQKIISRLSKEAVREHENIRKAGESGVGVAEGSYAQQQGHQAAGDISNLLTGIPVVGQAANLLNSSGKPGKHDKPHKPGKHGHSHSNSGGGSAPWNQAQQFAGQASSYLSGGYAPSYAPSYVNPGQGGYDAPGDFNFPQAHPEGYAPPPGPPPGGFAPPPGPPPGGFPAPQGPPPGGYNQGYGGGEW
ncbi:heterokaryon incompatibility protein HET-C [Flagelloscypha sp. PMI_526]|nr:heterokaryon incompatibility protein HET-C [Flagelloscypha sp. PMI_526]